MKQGQSHDWQRMRHPYAPGNKEVWPFLWWGQCFSFVLRRDCGRVLCLSCSITATKGPWLMLVICETVCFSSSELQASFQLTGPALKTVTFPLLFPTLNLYCLFAFKCVSFFYKVMKFTLSTCHVIHSTVVGV